VSVATEQMPADLLQGLAKQPVRAIVEYVAERLGCDDGHIELVFRLTNGTLRESETGRQKVRNEELDWLGRTAGAQSCT
jgi:hypothetical protein